MKKLQSLSLCLAYVTVVFISSADNLSLQIEPSQQAYVIGEPLGVQLILKNVGSQEVKVDVPSGVGDVEFRYRHASDETFGRLWLPVNTTIGHRDVDLRSGDQVSIPLVFALDADGENNDGLFAPLAKSGGYKFYAIIHLNGDLIESNVGEVFVQPSEDKEAQNEWLSAKDPHGVEGSPYLNFIQGYETVERRKALVDFVERYPGTEYAEIAREYLLGASEEAASFADRENDPVINQQTTVGPDREEKAKKLSVLSESRSERRVWSSPISRLLALAVGVCALFVAVVVWLRKRGKRKHNRS